MRKIILFISLFSILCNSFAQKQSLHHIAFLQKKIGLDSMVNDLKYINFGDDCLGFFVPIYLVSSIYTGYVLTTQSNFVEYHISCISNSDSLRATYNDYVEAYNLYGNYILQNDTLYINSDISTVYMEDTLFGNYFYKIEYDCSLISNSNIQNHKLLRKLFSNNGSLRKRKYENWPEHICELFRYGYITLAYWCNKEMEISLINPQFFHDIAFEIEK